ncbi:hypothetical protein [Methylotuvimicrobium sp. KM1]|uniref:hypothetical protein n=1 Tax=Methylotuvimicrobium sp. KM1 TaxID=3377707 RepID=UPI00384C8AFC
MKNTAKKSEENFIGRCGQLVNTESLFGIVQMQKAIVFYISLFTLCVRIVPLGLGVNNEAEISNI